MKINFVSMGNNDLASHRFRVLKPYELLHKEGHTVSIKQFPDLEVDINVYQKDIAPEFILDWMKTIPTKKMFDVCDDHFDRPAAPFYKEACQLADVLTCTNTRMEKRLKELFPGKPVYVCYDPINTLPASPHGSNTPKIIWFGHSTNFQDASVWLGEVIRAGYQLTVVSNLPIETGGDFKYIKFENGWVEEHLREYDVVLLPTGETVKQPWINMKSENRFVDALNAGCTVIFNNDILYKDLSKYGVYETGSVAVALEKCKDTKSIAMIEKGQAHIRKKYSDEKITKQWIEAMNGTIKG